MSVFYDEASLVLVPSGYKASKVYAQKPLTTDGQLTFSRASTATRVNASGLIETVASNVPRLDYTNSTCPKLLLEPQRTNLVTYSEQFDNAAWGSGGVTITANNTASPSSYTDADLLLDNAVSGEHYVIGPIVGAAGTYTFSVFAKYNGSQWMAVYSNSVGIAYFDIQNGVIGTVTNGTATIESYGNGWYRCTLTATQLSSFRIIIAGASANGVLSYTPSGTTGRYIWGAQVEAGAYATSYVKTEAAAVTRLVDVGGNKTSASALIGQTQGTMFFEFVAGEDTSAASAILYGIFDSTSSNNRIQLVSRLGLLTTYIEANSVGYAVNPTLATLTNGTTYKAALAYSAAGVVIYVNGVSVYTNASALAFTATLETISVGSRATIDSYGKGERISQILLFKTRLTNAQLAEITQL